jgi:hypothetical protein
MANAQVEKMVSQICSCHCTFTCHKSECPRGEWHKSSFDFKPLPKSGTDNKCPLMQFVADRIESNRWSVPLDSLTDDDLWAVCYDCKYSKVVESLNVDGPTISLEDSFYSHCIDCPITAIRDVISEGAAEAGCS